MGSLDGRSRVFASGFRVQDGFGFRVQDLGFMLQDLRLRMV